MIRPSLLLSFLILVLLLLAIPAFSQDLFQKAPPDVEDALRARITQFYQAHADGKFRLAENLVAEESKDGFYAANKPDLKSFRISEISYGDDFKKAKATIIGKMVIGIMGFGNGPMDVPFPSYWKVENGKWCWYINRDGVRVTPFGTAGGKTSGEATDPATGFAQAPTVEKVQSKVKAEPSLIRLSPKAGASGQVTVLNDMPGPITVKPERGHYKLLDLKVEPEELEAGQKATVTIRAKAADAYQSGVIRLRVMPSNQLIDVHVKFE